MVSIRNLLSVIKTHQISEFKRDSERMGGALQTCGLCNRRKAYGAKTYVFNIMICVFTSQELRKLHE